MALDIAENCKVACFHINVSRDFGWSGIQQLGSVNKHYKQNTKMLLSGNTVVYQRDYNRSIVQIAGNNSFSFLWHSEILKLWNCGAVSDNFVQKWTVIFPLRILMFYSHFLSVMIKWSCCGDLKMEIFYRFKRKIVEESSRISK